MRLGMRIEKGFITPLSVKDKSTTSHPIHHVIVGTILFYMHWCLHDDKLTDFMEDTFTTPTFSSIYWLVWLVESSSFQYYQPKYQSQYGYKKQEWINV